MWGSLDPNAPESWPEDPAVAAWKDAEAKAALAAQERAKPARTWGDTWNDIKNTASGLVSVPPAQFGSLSPQALNDDPFTTAAARTRASVRPVSGRAEGPATKIAEALVPAAGEAVVSGVTAPGDAMSGKLPMYGPDGHTSLEAVRRGFDTASLAGGGAVGGAASRAVPQLAADAAKAGAPIAAAAHTPQGFYSALDEAVGKASMTRAPGQQWEATLRNAGVKPEEMDWRGASQLFAEKRGQPITKEELQAHLQANPVPQIKPVEYAGAPAWEKLTPEAQYEVENMWRPQRHNYTDPKEFYEDRIAPQAASGDYASITGPTTKWDEYQLGGPAFGSMEPHRNYRERLLTTPDTSTPIDKNLPFHERIEIGQENMRRNYKSSHWQEPNVLVHRRSTDRRFGDPMDSADAGWYLDDIEQKVQAANPGARLSDMGSGAPDAMVKKGVLTPEEASAWASYNSWNSPGYYDPATNKLTHQGGTRSLHAEEIQSDWHQAGRKKGYGDPEIVREGDRWRAMAGDREIGRGRIEDFPGGDRQIIDNLKGSTVPDAPFKKTWHELAVKDMLREAVEGDYPRISWTAGGHNPTNPKNLNTGGGAPNAERLAAYEKADAGMRGFYDKMIPDYLNKLGKKYGAKVERGTLPDRGGMSGEKAMDRMGVPKAEQEAFWESLGDKPGGRDEFMKQARDRGHDVFYMDIPQSMRDDIRNRGMALFEDSSPGQAVATAGALNERAGAQAGLDVRGGLEGGAGGARSVAEAEATAARHAGAIQPLEGLPRKPLPVGGEPYVPGPIGSIHDVAKSYMEGTGRPYVRQDRYHPVNEEHSTAIAKAFDEMKHEPDNPRVKASYDALAKETRDQYDALLKSGVKIEAIPPGTPDPYAATPRLAAKDVQENNHLWFFPTDQGFGSGAGGPMDLSKHPMMAQSGRELNGAPLLNNDLFRVVHDYFGHLKEGYGFRAAGEDNAWRTHANMYSDLARPAMTTETRGQNSWVNYGPHGEANRKASAGDTVYSDQKVGLLPDWVMGNPDAPRPGVIDEAGNAIQGAAFSKEAKKNLDAIKAGPKGAGPLDLSTQSQVPEVPQQSLDRYVPPRGISDRMVDALKNKDVIAGLKESIKKGKGVENWYHTDPVRKAFVDELGSEDGAKEFGRFMDYVAATSPRSDVPTNIRNASYYYAGGDPDKKNPYPYGHVAQNLHKQNIKTVDAGGGWDVMQNPKPASFAQNLRGNLEPVTVDTHAFRNVAMRTGDPRFLETSFTQKRSSKPSADEESLISRFGSLDPERGIATFRPAQLHKEGKLTMEEAKNIPSFWASKPKANEYAAVEKLFRDIGNKVGMRPADAQAAAWSGGGSLTGLGTVGTHTFNELFNERVLYTAKMRNENPEKVLKDFIRKKKPLLVDSSHGVAFGALNGGQEE